MPLTRERIESRLLRLATNAQVFASRKATSAEDRDWCARVIADIEALLAPEGGR